MKRRLQLQLTIAFSLVALVTSLVSDPPWLQAVFALPLVLVLPGFAIAANLFGPGAISPAERGVLTVALSVAVAAVGGLVLQLVFALDTVAWAILLGSVTVLAAVRGIIEEPINLSKPERRWPWSTPLLVVSVAAAIVVVGLSISSASDGVNRAEAETRYTDLWILPSATSSRSEIVTVGVRSHENRATDYALQILRGRSPVAQRELRLAPGRSWEGNFTVPLDESNGNRIIAALNKGGREYRHVYVEVEG